MPLFPGERSLTPEEAASDEFRNIALSFFREQTGLRREEAAFSVHVVNADVGQVLYFIARPFQPVLGPTQQRYPDPTRWWIFDADVDETEGWRAQGSISESGLIFFNGIECGGGFVMPVVPNDEGDTLGAAPPRPRPGAANAERLRAALHSLSPEEVRRQTRLQGQVVTPEENEAEQARRQGMTPQQRALMQAGFRWGDNPPPASIPRQAHEELQRQRGARLPQGNSSVRDAVQQMRELDAKDATYEDDTSLDEVMLGNHFMERTASPTFQTEPARPEPDPTMADVVGTDITGRPLIARRDAPKTVYDHLNENLQDIRAARPAPSVWDRLAAQRKSK